MSRTLTEEQSVTLARLLIMMGIPKELCLEVISLVETVEDALLFLDKLSEKNYQMTPEEVSKALTDALMLD